MRITTWPPSDFQYLEPTWDPKYQTEPSWFLTHQFEYHLILVVAAIICIIGIARIIWSTKRK